VRERGIRAAQIQLDVGSEESNIENININGITNDNDIGIGNGKRNGTNNNFPQTRTNLGFVPDI
jgi:hypothetical protein